MPKTIAFLTTQLNGWYQSQVWRGVVAATRTQNCRLLCLVGNVDYSAAPLAGAKGLFYLASQAQIDGVLISGGPLTSWHGAKALANYTESLAGKPAVSIGCDSDQLDCVFPEGRGIADLMEHLVHTHDCKRIAFLGGTAGNPDAERRFADYRDALRLMNLPYSAELVENGTFTLESGAMAMQIIIDRDVAFDAVIAANDAMALGAATVLKRVGLRVPRDVKLVGYDDSREGQFMQPPLTTVLNPTNEMTMRALSLCLDRLREPSLPFSRVAIAGRPIIRKSCGCLESPQDLSVFSEEMQVVEMLVGQLLSESDAVRQNFLYWLREQLSSGAPNAHVDCERWVQLVGQVLREHHSAKQLDQAISIFGLAQQILFEAKQGELSADLLRQGLLIRDLHRLESAVLAHVEPQKIMSAIAAHLQTWCPGGARMLLFHSDLAPEPEKPYIASHFLYKVAMQAGELRALPPSDDLLPNASVGGDIWTAVPLEHGGLRFGVLIFHNWVNDESFLDNLRIIVSAALAISWRTRSEVALRETLRHLSLRDELTGLYNRRGMQELGKLQQRRAQRDRQLLAVILMDLDGLKVINDVHGHADGDLAISSFASVLMEAFRTSDIVARFGGDEFTALAVVESASDLEVLIARLRRFTHERNSQLAKPWELQFSIGWALWEPCDAESFESQMAQADQMLYKEKAQKKHR